MTSRDRRGFQAAVFALAIVMGAAHAQSADWKDPSTHQAQFITVEPGVKLEVLDWGGTGQPIVLLAGYDTAHEYDDFAPKLAQFCHVYGITRRGYGASSRTESGYTAARSAEDVLQVLDALKLIRPVLVGHSFGGQDLSSLGATHSDRLGGLVYLNSAEDPTLAFPPPAGLQGVRPAAMRNPPKEDFSSFQAYRESQLRIHGVAFPEAELRALYAANPDGSIGKYSVPGWVRQAIFEGRVKPDYARIRVPVLAFYGVPPTEEELIRKYTPQNETERAAIELTRATDLMIGARSKVDLLIGVPTARVVNVPGANWYIFLSNPAELLREMKAFLAGLE
jgi:pimeloyl-ACP methyl ester carboxylesterase